MKFKTKFMCYEKNLASLFLLIILAGCSQTNIEEPVLPAQGIEIVNGRVRFENEQTLTSALSDPQLHDKLAEAKFTSLHTKLQIDLQADDGFSEEVRGVILNTNLRYLLNEKTCLQIGDRIYLYFNDSEYSFDQSLEEILDYPINDLISHPEVKGEKLIKTMLPQGQPDNARYDWQGENVYLEQYKRLFISGYTIRSISLLFLNAYARYEEYNSNTGTWPATSSDYIELSSVQCTCSKLPIPILGQTTPPSQFNNASIIDLAVAVKSVSVEGSALLQFRVKPINQVVQPTSGVFGVSGLYWP